MNTTAVIAEDEPLLLAQLKVKLARAWPALEIVAAVGDGEAALDAIAEHRPTFAFLDIQMPELTGIEVARRLARDPGAIDYLLKPYSDERLNATIQRLQARLSEANSTYW